MDNERIVQGIESEDGHMHAHVPPTCYRCNKYIYDGTILKVNDHLCHNACLTCIVCQRQVSNMCHIHNHQVYCRSDFIRMFGVKCAGCHKVVTSSEAGHVVEGSMYHMTCFTCNTCRRSLQPGESFYVKEDGKLLCYQDYKHTTHSDGNSPTESESDESGSDEIGRSSGTCLHDNQLRMLLKAYQSTPRPNRAERQILTSSTGLPHRDVQLWFRNKRRNAKHNKLEQGEMNRNTPDSLDCSNEPVSNTIAPPQLQLPVRQNMNVDRPDGTQYQIYCPLDYMVPGEMPPNIDLSAVNICNGEIVMDKKQINAPRTSDVQTHSYNGTFRQWLSV